MRLRASIPARRVVAAAAVTAIVAWASATCGGGGGRLSTGAPTTGHRAPAPKTAPVTTTTTVPVTTTVPTTVAPTTAPKPALVAGPGVAVGDSVLEDVKIYAAATLESHNISINAAVSRQWMVGVGILSALRSGGKLPPVVIVALGSNGRIDDSLFDQMMQACAGARRVVFMTVTGPLIGNNPVIASGVARYHQAVLADWNSVAAAHPEWFAPDHVHVGPAGAAALGNLLASVS